MLSKMEIVALRGIGARDREIQERYIKPLQADLNEIVESINSRLKAIDPSFELGRTHALDLNTIELKVKEPEPEPVKEPAPEPALKSNRF